MFKAVKNVCDEACKRAGSDRLNLEVITQVFIDTTIIDEVHFVEFDTPVENPFLGRFSRWGRQPSAYAAFETVVEIGYAKHLTEDWRRFVVCKELCHALDMSSGVHVVSTTSMDHLVSNFSLLSAQSKVDGKTPGFEVFAPELLSQGAAIELLFPMAARDAILQGNPDALNDMEAVKKVALEYNLPMQFVLVGLIPEYNNVIKGLMA